MKSRLIIENIILLVVFSTLFALMHGFNIWISENFSLSDHVS